MNQIYPTEGLGILAGGLIAGGLRWHLYTNDVTPVRGSISTDFVEVTAAGYAPIDKDFTDPINTIALNDRGLASTSPAVFFQTSGASVNVYGYFVTDTNGNPQILFAARFDGAPLAMVDSELFPVSCFITDSSLLP